MFTSLRTERLVLRPFVPEDVENVYARRNDPEVASLQDWDYPFSREKAQRLVDSVIALGGPANEEWWMAVICRPDDQVVGDLALHLGWNSQTAEVGYSLDREHWGNGYATEALARLVDYLFDDLGVTRVFGMLDPNNAASARVLERTGFLYEGRTRLSYWKAGEVSDDLIYGMVREDRDAWVSRPRTAPETVDLVEVDVGNYKDVAALQTHQSQTKYVASTLRSLADAMFPEMVDGAPVAPWMRVVQADGDLVGFVMLAMITEHHPEPYLWRLLIDRMHQGRGIGRLVLERVSEESRAWGAGSLLTSWVEGPGSPRDFYERLGFVLTGRILEGETEARLDLVAQS